MTSKKLSLEETDDISATTTAVLDIDTKSSDSDVLDALINAPKDKLIPWESCVLPSHGAYYDGRIPGGKVEVRAMGIQAEKVLATQRLAQSGESIDWLFKECVRFPDPEFDPLDLLVGDRVFLLFYLRGITHGNFYEFLVQCSDENCKHKCACEYDLNTIADTLTTPNYEIGDEPFKVVLPYFSKIVERDVWVKVRLLRGRDMQRMMQKHKFSKRAGIATTIDQTVEENLSMVIVEAMGSKEPYKISSFIEKMHSLDTATVREFLRENTPGIDATIEVQCDECGNTMKTELPVTETFFRPSKQ